MRPSRTHGDHIHQGMAVSPLPQGHMQGGQKPSAAACVEPRMEGAAPEGAPAPSCLPCACMPTHVLGLDASQLNAAPALIHAFFLLSLPALGQLPRTEAGELGQVGVQLVLLVDPLLLDAVPALLLGDAQRAGDVVPEVQPLLLGEVGDGLVVALHLHLALPQEEVRLDRLPVQLQRPLAVRQRLVVLLHLQVAQRPVGVVHGHQGVAVLRGTATPLSPGTPGAPQGAKNKIAPGVKVQFPSGGARGGHEPGPRARRNLERGCGEARGDPPQLGGGRTGAPPLPVGVASFSRGGAKGGAAGVHAGGGGALSPCHARGPPSAGLRPTGCCYGGGC
uniref:Uncharacterized protein n=1 Tax=Cairina moschata TaxID=8855 RepID=A0A8C3BW29_CAIMO